MGRRNWVSERQLGLLRKSRCKPPTPLPRVQGRGENGTALVITAVLSDTGIPLNVATPLDFLFHAVPVSDTSYECFQAVPV